jgi:hypothetical protein
VNCRLQTAAVAMQVKSWAFCCILGVEYLGLMCWMSSTARRWRNPALYAIYNDFAHIVLIDVDGYPRGMAQPAKVAFAMNRVTVE